MTKIKQEIERVKRLEQEGVDNTISEQIAKEVWKHRGRQNERDAYIFQCFQELAAAGEEENDNRFRLSYVNDLPVDWKILILLGKKNIGKTYNIHKLIDECLETDRQLFMVRVTAKEIITALVPFFEEERSKVRVITRANNSFDLIEKTPENSKKKGKKIGYCASISTLTSYQGASYDKVKYIIWDECISDGSNQKITDAQIRGFERFISSIARNKDDIKVIIFGNLLEKVDGHAGDPVLAYYGIDPSCNCKYIEAQNDSQANVLFLNTGSMFKGIEVQGVLGGVDTGITENLLSNKISEDGIKTVNPPVYWEAQPTHTLLMSYDTVIYSIHIRESDLPQTPKYLIIWIKRFHVNDVNASKDNKQVFTNEQSLANKYSHCVSYVEDEVWSDLVEHLLDHLAANRVFYVQNETAELIDKLSKHFKYNLTKEESFPEFFA